MKSCGLPRYSVILLAVSAIWVFTGEVGIHYIYSLKWQWPQLGLSRDYLEREFTVRNPQNMLATGHRYHYQDGDSHYYIMPGSDQQGEGKKESGDTGLHVLIMSDPHIMCTFDNEVWLTRQDSDRYLSTAYSYLVNTLHPDMVILLGDVFSDGFHASTSQWKDYLNCLKSTFPVTSRVKLMVAYGDNDIGGEGRDYMTDKVSESYVEAFGTLNSNQEVRGIQFIKLTTVCFINDVPRTRTEVKCREDLDSYISEHSETLLARRAPRIVLSHIPLHRTHTNRHHLLREKVLRIYPNYIFSGHIHHQSYSTHVLWDQNDEGESVKRLSNEITVPTCSYRMGEQYMGVGVAVIGSDGNMAYRVLWLPPRYPFLISYGVMAAALISILWCRCMRTRLRI